MLTKCSYCGEVAVDDSENHQVCHSCGVVFEDIKLSSTEYTPRSYVPFTKFGARLQRKKKSSTCLMYGLNVLDHLCHENEIAKYKTEIAELFKNICVERTFSNKEDAGVTVGCCVVLIQRNYKQAIPIKKICQQIGCTRKKFSFYLNYVKSYLSTHKSENNFIDTFEEESENSLSDILTSLIQEICEKAEKEEKNELMRKLTALVKLADDCWLLTGRSPRSVIVASAYLCWKSMSPLRRKASFCKFCKMFGVRETVAKLRIPELRVLLLKLGQKIPSYGKNVVNEDNLLFHLDTILDNSESLRNDLLTDVHESEAINCREYSSFRFPVQTQHRKEPSSPVIYAPDMKASDIEISDTEIESYMCVGSKNKIIELCKKEEETDCE